MNSTPKQEISDIERRHAQRNREHHEEPSDSTKFHNFSDVFSLVLTQDEKAVNIFLFNLKIRGTGKAQLSVQKGFTTSCISVRWQLQPRQSTTEKAAAFADQKTVTNHTFLPGRILNSRTMCVSATNWAWLLPWM